MGVLKVRTIIIAAAVGVLLLIVIVLGLRSPNTETSKTLDTITYTNSISGTSGTFYTNKASEVVGSGVAFVNSDALQTHLNNDQFITTLPILRSFVEAQSHYLSSRPIISNVTQSGNDVHFSLFIDTGEVSYDVTLSFTDQTPTPTVTFEVAKS